MLVIFCRFRRPDVSPTAVKSPVDTDGHHSYFSNKMKEGQEPLESGDGMQMGRFVKKSGLRLGGDELVSDAQQFLPSLVVLKLPTEPTIPVRTPNARSSYSARR